MTRGLNFFLTFSTVLALSVTATGTELPDWAPPQVHGTDVTWEFREHQRGVRALDLSHLRDHHVLLIPGFMTGNMAILKHLPIKKNKLGIGGYMGDYVEFFQQNGISYSISTIETEATPENNAHHIAREIQAIEKPVILLGHSKGGVDAVQTMIDYPDLRSKVKAIISLQAPHHGTPVIDVLSIDRKLVKFFRGLLKLLGGDVRAFHGMRADVRERWMRDHIDEISRFQKEVPVISFASWKDPSKKKSLRWDSLLTIPRDLILKYLHAKNDGMVPWQAAVLPGSDYIAVGDTDHSVTVLESPFVKFDRRGFLQTMLGMALARAR